MSDPDRRVVPVRRDRAGAPRQPRPRRERHLACIGPLILTFVVGALLIALYFIRITWLRR
jgi:hypothetical protein